jgi:hypothetical protein
MMARAIHHDGLEIVIQVRHLQDLFGHLQPHTYVCSAYAPSKGRAFVPQGARAPVFFEAGTSVDDTITSIANGIRKGRFMPWKQSNTI